MLHNLEFSSPGYDDLRVPLSAIKLGGLSNPDWVKFRDNGAGSTGVYTYAFDKASEEEVFFEVQLPHSWMQGDTLHPHVHWTSLANGTDKDVAWGLEYTMSNILGSFGTTTIISSNTQIASQVNVVAHKHMMTSLPDITMTGMTRSSMISCRLFRDATGALKTDDFDDDAILLEFDFHYQKNRMGTVAEY